MPRNLHYQERMCSARDIGFGTHDRSKYRAIKTSLHNTLIPFHLILPFHLYSILPSSKPNHLDLIQIQIHDP